MKQFLRRSWPDLVVVLCFLLVSFAYFATPISEGLVLGGHDTVAGMGQGQEQTAYHEATGERSRWTNSIFSGMPTYQISPTYGSTKVMGVVETVVRLCTSGPLGFLFLYLFGFYLLMRALRFKPLLSAFGATAWAFSSYFLIIIAAGHLWKVNTLGFIPPTIAGLVLAYRGKYLWGATVTALFAALQIAANHLQMTYYFLFVMLFVAVAYGIEALRSKTLGRWAKATGALLVGGLLAAAVNLPNLYHTWQYSKESMRGKTELTVAAPKTAEQKEAPEAEGTDGLARDYITQWSYGIDETLTLLMPDFKGGGSSSILERDGVEGLKGYDEFYQYATQLQQATGSGNIPGINQYWGDQPFTVGPVYVGAIICFLFLLGLGLVRGPLKWALAAATLLSFLFAWGHNFMGATDFFIDVLPMYAKFRTVSSALVIAEFTMPVLAMLALAEVIRHPEKIFGTRRGKVSLGVAAVLTVGVSLFYALVPDASNLLSTADSQAFAQLQQLGLPADFVNGYKGAILQLHAAILSATAWRAFFLSLIALALVAAYAKWPKAIPSAAVVGVLLVLTLGDLWNIDRRYLNTDSFKEPEAMQGNFAKSPADQLILKDKDPDYRVLNLSGGSPFNETSNQTAFWHKSIGGYHAAKLRRYQELINFYLDNECQHLSEAAQKAYAQAAADSAQLAARGIRSQEQLNAYVASTFNTDSVTPVLNMLNMKWVILGNGNIALQNAHANGNAWFVNEVKFVPNADAEIQALGKLDLKHQAVADARFESLLKGATDGQGRIELKHYAPNELRYTSDNSKDGVAVFSEIYYPGWTATIDGKPVEVARVNYVLRALRVPAGHHEIVLTFRPTSVTTTEYIAYAAIVLLIVGFLFAAWRQWRTAGETTDEQETPVA